MLSVDILDTNILAWFGGMAPLGDPPQNQFFGRLNLRCQCFLISAVDTLKTNTLAYIGGAALRGPPKNRLPKINFLIGLC